MILKDIIKKFDKSNIKAGDGFEKGNYPLYTCSPIVNKFLNDYLYDDEAIIISTGGNFSAHYVKGRFNYSTDCYVFNTDKYNLKYLYYFLLSKNEDINKMFRGAGLKHLNKNEFVMLNIKEISLNEQDRIVNQLDKINEMIEVRKKEIDKCNNLIKSQFVEMFGRYKITTNLSRYISELRGGKSLAGNEICKNKVLKTGAATFGWFDPEQYKYLPLEYTPLPEHKVETGDVMISRMNTPELVGASSYVFEAPEDTYYPDRLWKVILNSDSNPIFLWQLLWDEKIRKQIKEKSAGTSGTMQNISKQRLLEIKCIDAPIELQNKFAQIVEQIDKQKFVNLKIFQLLGKKLKK